MSIDRDKVLTIAQKYLVKGQLDKAIAEYEKLIKDDPKDSRTLLKIGDIYARKGDTKEACATYQSVAMQYAEQGFFQKAVAVYKQILNIDPAHRDALEKLGEMYKLLNLTSEALTTYEQIYAFHTSNGDKQLALDALREIAQLEPRNAASWLRYAEALSETKRVEEAIRIYESTAKLLKEAGRLDDYLKVVERLLFHRPGDTGLACDIAELYLDRGETRNALVRLQSAFRANPKDLRTLELLARGFQQLGQNSKTVSVYKEIARLHEEAKRTASQAQPLVKAVERSREEAQVASKPETLPEEVSSRTSLPVAASVEPRVSDNSPSAPAAPQTALSPSERPRPASEAAETEAHYSSFPTVDPLSAGDSSEIPSLPPVAVELPAAVLTSARPDSAPSGRRPPTEPGVRSLAASSAARAAFAAPVAHPQEEDVFFVQESEPGQQQASQPPESAEENLMAKEPEAAISIPPASEAPIPWPSVTRQEARVAVSPSSIVPSSSPPSPAIRASEVPREVADIVEEADFYFAQRLVTEAHGTLEDGLTKHPDNPLLLHRLQEIDRDKKDRKAQTSKPPESRRPEPVPAASSTESHYERGIAYMEMELHDNAIKEFKAALDNRDLECTVHTMIGLCYVAKGNAREGLNHFNLGLAAPNRSETEEIGLLYEIGNAYEVLKMRAEALEKFKMVAALDPDFRNIAQRIERLENPENIDDDLKDFDRLFDEIILKE